MAEELGVKGLFRVGADFALSMMRAASRGATTFVDEHKGDKPLSECTSKSVETFFREATQAAVDARDKLAEESRKEQKDEQKDELMDAMVTAFKQTPRAGRHLATTLASIGLRDAADSVRAMLDGDNNVVHVPRQTRRPPKSA
jgi:hypothetical protein